jgi:hypothetical protein
MREIERLVAEVSPKPDVRSSIRALPVKAELEYGELFMVTRRRSGSLDPPGR